MIQGDDTPVLTDARQVAGAKRDEGPSLFEDDLDALRKGRLIPVPMSAWHWFWYGPLIACVLAMVEWHTARYAVEVLRLWWARWSWGALISPSADFCLSVVLTSVFLPIGGVIGVTTFLFDPDTLGWASRRTAVVSTLLILAAILLLPFVTDALIWGSFPFTFEDGAWRLRMIPFFPWPERPYGQF